MDAVAEFNTLTHTSMSEGKPFATPLSVERMDVFGNITHRWNMAGRYSVPRLVGGSDTTVRRTRSGRRTWKRNRRNHA